MQITQLPEHELVKPAANEAANQSLKRWLLRGLVLLGVIALLFYYSWWFTGDRLAYPWLLLTLIPALLYGGSQLLGSWGLYLIARQRATAPPPLKALSVDVLITSCGESHDLIEKALKAAIAMQGSHQTWLLDDGADPDLARLANDLEVGYLTRPDLDNAKAGNVNAGLAQTRGDIVVIFDADHMPRSDFLQQTLGYLTNPHIGFVQVMPTFFNGQQNWLGRAAIETSLDFYNPISKGMDRLDCVTKMGSNALIRRTALESIGGYQPGLAEDLATSIALHAAGWRSAYVAEPLAPGLSPPDLHAWFTQQLKWSRGVFEVLVTAFPRPLNRLSWGQRLTYLVRLTKYWIGPAICVHLLATIAVLFSQNSAILAGLETYLLHFLPLVLMEVLIRQVALNTWRHPSLTTGAQWRAVALVYATWPVYTLAWLMALLRLPLGFRPTPKRSGTGLNPLWLLPQIVSALLLGGGIFYLLAAPETCCYPLVVGFAILQAALNFGLPGYLLKLKLATRGRSHA